MTLPFWGWPLLVPLVLFGLVVWLAIGLAVMARALCETAVETW